MDYDFTLQLEDNNLVLISSSSLSNFLNNKVYKLKLKKYVSSGKTEENKLFFKKEIGYIKYKKIIEIIEDYSLKNNIDFYISKELEEYIYKREMYINERSRVGLGIKKQSEEVLEKYQKYKTIIDEQMSRKLREKQAWDSFFMFTMKKSANFSVPGSGKTSSVYGVFSFLSSQGLVDKIVMIGPKNSFISWKDEFYNCFNDKRDLKLFNIQDYSSTRSKKNALLYEAAHKKNLLLFNYESLDSILEEVKTIIDDKTLLVFDEVHKVKNPNGKRAKNSLEISYNAKYTIALTGTPIPNSYLDIKNLLNILYHEEYNDFFGFKDVQLQNTSEYDIEDINKKIQPFFCRTTKKQLEVPEANPDIIILCKVSDKENQIFNILLLKYAKNRLALIIRLLQLESNPKMLLKAISENQEDFSDILDTTLDPGFIDYIDYSQDIIDLINSIDRTKKFNFCIQQVEQLNSEGKSVIVWCIFVDSIRQLAFQLEKKGISVGVIYGSTSEEERRDILNKFKEKEIDVLITNPHTLAESVSLHSVCHDAIYYEYSYNLVHLLQSKDRIHRLGLKEGQYTQYYFLHSIFLTRDGFEYSLDQKIYQRLLEKERIMLEAIDKDILESLGSIEDDIEIIFKDLKF
ncbi:DEAD/DEAH box helicase [Fusobacterium nucleatum subsp. nucleatum ATCC 23726]|uniref:Helicase C-terminal domain protein n=1 Tax=Fusobacterium nucleatum subsp. nucleatum (strain ATCC 23726 / VPI 4351) TaxID=525283 RepID=D5RF05_FUSN2|nr:DEAD/DEAH box helicase [Fusobacterium nucleatum]AVQ22741.1 helicase [Fusobacterium nucleatum subsp. nucleatum ATCC 23726]EFG94624.1 helicase C-terminal domain protein [Fusobacterium nucleatum subsp. nucleatum ATCC 23726]